MNHDHDACDSPCAEAPPPLELAEVLERFESEASWGECDLARYRCPYYTWGTGPPLLFIHGLCDDARSFVLPIARLSQQFRCIAYNLPTGNGDRAQLAGYRHADLVGDVWALLEHLDIPQTYLFASSFGSTIALAAMHERPECFPRAVLQGGFAHRPLGWGEVLLARLARYWPWPMHRLPLRVPVIRRSHHGPFAGRSPDLWDFFLERNGAPPMAAVARRAILLHDVDLRKMLAQIQQPILLICGDCDPLVDRACEKVLLDGLPHATRAEFENCGHLPQYSHPELLAEVTQRFLMPLSCPDVCGEGERAVNDE